MEKCLFKDCERDIRGGSRGLCITHYMGYRNRVKSGKDTWEQLEKDEKARRPLTQAEKNINQMHPHRSYTRRELI